MEKLGRRWHFSKKGFHPDRNSSGNRKCLRNCANTWQTSLRMGNSLWNNQQLVHMFVPGQKIPWASILTKKADWVELHLNCQKDLFAMGEIVEVGTAPNFDTTAPSHDVMKLKFDDAEQLQHPAFEAVLQRHTNLFWPSPSSDFYSIDPVRLSNSCRFVSEREVVTSSLASRVGCGDLG